MDQYLWLIPLGLVIGACGTLIGAGGGFVLMPLLLLLYPYEAPKILTCISLAIVFFNALSGSGAYARMRRIDYRSAFLFSAATIPGAILGALTTTFVPRQLFNATFGLFMILASALMLRSGSHKREEKDSPKTCLIRNLIEANGTRHTYSFNPIIGVGLSLLVGYVSSLLGIGGGVVHVPILVRLLNFPVYIATATSQFMLAVMALAGTGVHIVTGAFSHGYRRTICLSIGVLIGAQLGAHLSKRVHGDWIIRGLAIALGLVGVRIFIMVL